MVFSSVSFLWYFLPAVVVGYFVLRGRARNYWLVAASLVFYVWGGGYFIVILFVSIVVDYTTGSLAQRAVDRGNDRLRRGAVVGSVVANMLMLGYFKYANFLVDQFATLQRAFGFSEAVWERVALPIGISFFTFQSMSYTIDVARGASRHLRNPIDFALYVSLFPQLIAGPIVRYHEIADQIREREHAIDDVVAGLIRFGHGLVKKVVIADSVAGLVNAGFSSSELATGHVTTATAWIAVAAYTVQIYFDFSGYSDMAIGLGRIFGFRFPENFRRPYSAFSITEFWRRWHITLSNWFRDYVYVPLGGSRGISTATIYRNLWMVFLITGIWHGANWTFIVWGIYHGAWLVAERRFDLRSEPNSRWMRVIRRMTTFGIVMMGWVIFRAVSVGDAFSMLQALWSFNGFGLSDAMSAALSMKAMIMLSIGLASTAMPRSLVIGPLLEVRQSLPARGLAVLLLVVVLPYALALTASGSFSPFLYFQF
jgi:alginate O-acetyltransferase complex protein AlgI